MKIKSLRLQDFRNFENFEVQFADRLNLFIGQNGQGKSNLLEALSLLILNESFRYADNENLIQFHKPGSFIEALLEKNSLDFKAKLQILKSRKNLTWNEKKITLSTLRENISCVVFSPESLTSVKDGSDERRILVDQAVSATHFSGAALISDFRKALKTRNRILKDFSEGQADKKTTLALLESLDPIYLRLSIELTMARIELLRGLQPDLQEAMQFIVKEPVDISVEYSISRIKSSNLTADQVHDAIHQRLLELRDAELGFGSSLVGPHKHEITFFYNQKDSRFYCSQGQQRAMILSFKMAQIVYHRKVHGTYPILLLDDVLSELDIAKRNSLIEFLHGIKTQIFLTTTDLQFTKDVNISESKIFELKEGRIL